MLTERRRTSYAINGMETLLPTPPLTKTGLSRMLRRDEYRPPHDRDLRSDYLQLAHIRWQGAA